MISWFVYDPVYYGNLKLHTAMLPSPGVAWKVPSDLFVKGDNYDMTLPLSGSTGKERPSRFGT
jgi:hypothetical protein